MENRIDQARTRCDMARMTGTIANWTGMALPQASHCLAPVSSVGGLIGASCGAAQLHQGLTMPSGVNDPHLITKGVVTTAVGGTCMMLGAAASAWPVLFYGAAGLGLVGLATAITVDAHMDGLCRACRGCEGDPVAPVKVNKVLRRKRKDPASKGVISANSSCWRWVGRLSEQICQVR